VLDEMQKEFNQTVLYGRDVTPSAIFSTARRYPMMSNYQVVIIREAQDVKFLLKGSEDDDEASERDDSATSAGKKGVAEKDPFLLYLSNPQPTTILVFCYKYKKIDKRTRVSKELEKSAVLFDSKKMYPNQVPAWVVSYVKSKGYTIAEKASNLIAEYLGTELSKVSNELDKLMIGLKAGSEITPSQIEAGIGISKDYNVFELQDAMGKRDTLKVARIISYFGANPKNNPLVMILPALANYFTKIITVHAYRGKQGANLAGLLGVNPFFVKDYEAAARNYPLDTAIEAISLIHEYDLRSKGVNNASAGDNDLLKEMVFRIMNSHVLAV
jgi:DNA polymerase-3 subunit delta